MIMENIEEKVEEEEEKKNKGFSFGDLIRACDLFSTPVLPTLKRKQYFQTNLGAFMTMSLCALMLVYFILLMIAPSQDTKPTDSRRNLSVEREKRELATQSYDFLLEAHTTFHEKDYSQEEKNYNPYYSGFNFAVAIYGEYDPTLMNFVWKHSDPQGGETVSSVDYCRLDDFPEQVHTEIIVMGVDYWFCPRNYSKMLVGHNYVTLTFQLCVENFYDQCKDTSNVASHGSDPVYINWVDAYFDLAEAQSAEKKPISYVINSMNNIFLSSWDRDNFHFQFIRNVLVDIDGREIDFYRMEVEKYQYIYKEVKFFEWVIAKFSLKNGYTKYTQYYRYYPRSGRNLEQIVTSTTEKEQTNHFFNFYYGQVFFVLGQLGGLYVILYLGFDFISYYCGNKKMKHLEEHLLKQRKDKFKNDKLMLKFLGEDDGESEVPVLMKKIPENELRMRIKVFDQNRDLQALVSSMKVAEERILMCEDKVFSQMKGIKPVLDPTKIYRNEDSLSEEEKPDFQGILDAPKIKGPKVTAPKLKKPKPLNQVLQEIGLIAQAD